MRKLMLGVLCLVSSMAWAGNQTGTVSRLEVRANDGLIYFELTGSHVEKPVCATHSYWMIRDENSNVGKQQYSLLLTALSSGKSIVVLGMNSCTRWPDGEDVGSIVIGP